MPRNPYASAYLNGAYDRLQAAIQIASPPCFTLCPTADQFEEAALHLGNLASAFDEYIHAFASEAQQAGAKIITDDMVALASNAVHDSNLIADMKDVAESLREDEAHRDPRDDHGTLIRWQRGI